MPKIFLAILNMTVGVLWKKKLTNFNLTCILKSLIQIPSSRTRTLILYLIFIKMYQIKVKTSRKIKIVLNLIQIPKYLCSLCGKNGFQYLGKNTSTTFKLRANVCSQKMNFDCLNLRKLKLKSILMFSKLIYQNGKIIKWNWIFQKTSADQQGVCLTAADLKIWYTNHLNAFVWNL